MVTEETHDRTPPQDVPAEQSVLGAMLLSEGARKEMLDALRPEDFYRPAHGKLFAAIEAMTKRGDAVDAVTIVPELIAQKTLNAVGGAPYVHTLIERVPLVSNAGHYAETVRDRALLRAIIAAGTETVQRAFDPGVEGADDVAQWASDRMAGLRDYGLYDVDAETPAIEEMLAERITYDWLLPGLMERGDRLVLSGVEGCGKTTASRQIAACSAAGLHPFTQARLEPLVVLVVDLENGRGLNHRAWGRLHQSAQSMGRPIESQRLFIEQRPSGLDVSRPADARWLLRRVERLRPDLLVIGPVYRLSNADPNDERSARDVTQVLDQCRAVNGCAVIAETHSPHGQQGAGKRPVRPVGSSLWLRWPEFGYGIRPANDEIDTVRRLVDFVPWRGPRDERQWPTRLEAGSPWPWVEAQPDGYRGAA